MGRRSYSIPDHINPREYQRDAVDAMKELLATKPEQWHLFSAPTGTGKSIVQLMFLSEVEDSILITPRLEIVAGMLQKMGEKVDGLNDIKLTQLAWDKYGIITPVRLRNLLCRGDVPFMPSCLVIDECHHDTAETYQDISMYLNGCPKIGLTATPYRGTPKQTREFHRQWGDTVNVILSLSDAVERGYYQVPNCEVWPLIDDDTIDVSSGDFRVSSCETKLENSFDLIVANCKRYYDSTFKLWDMPTIFALPGTKTVGALHAAFSAAGIPTVFVTQATSRFDRIKAFDACINCQAALIQINVVSEGVDLPIRRVIDCSPTMSPVRWFQQVGRIRPANGVPPEYICCCRNLERHCYLFEGLLPNSAIQEAQTAFTDEQGVPVFSKRSGARVVGLEGLGRFVTTPIHLNNGTVGFMYNLVSTINNKRTEFIAFIHPNYSEPVYGIKESANDGVEMKWGKWRLIESIPDLKGCTSAKVNELSPKQEARWNSSAAFKGLDPNRKITSREFQILPFLLNTDLSFK